MKIVSSIFEILNFIIFIASIATVSTFDRFASNRQLLALSICAIFFFFLISALEYFRKHTIEHLNLRPKPPLTRDQIWGTTVMARNVAARSMAEESIMEANTQWKNQLDKDIQSKNSVYLWWEWFSFIMGIIFTILVIINLFFP